MKSVLGLLLGSAFAVKLSPLENRYDPYGTTRANWPGPILPGSEPLTPIPNKEEHFPYGEIMYYSQTKNMENGDESINL